MLLLSTHLQKSLALLWWGGEHIAITEPFLSLLVHFNRKTQWNIEIIRKKWLTEQRRRKGARLSSPPLTRPLKSYPFFKNASLFLNIVRYIWGTLILTRIGPQSRWVRWYHWYSTGHEGQCYKMRPTSWVDQFKIKLQIEPMSREAPRPFDKWPISENIWFWILISRWIGGWAARCGGRCGIAAYITRCTAPPTCQAGQFTPILK